MTAAARPAAAWFAAAPALAAAAWVVVGKGPTFDRYASPGVAGWPVLALNDAAAACPATTLAHATDLDAAARVAGPVAARPGVCLVVPYYPHVANRPGKVPVDRLLGDPGLRRLAAEGRLLWYRSSLSAARPHPPGGWKRAVTTRYFSAVAAVNLLGLAGVRAVRTAGVDGGTAYAAPFAGLTPLTNGRASFDVQFREVAAAVARFGLDFARL